MLICDFYSFFCAWHEKHQTGTWLLTNHIWAGCEQCDSQFAFLCVSASLFKKKKKKLAHKTGSHDDPVTALKIQ